MGVAYSFTVGPGKYAEYGKYLMYSIQQNSTSSKIFVYITEEERPKIQGEYLDFFEANGTVIIGSQPFDEYPIATKIAALKAALERTNDTPTVLLDTDTLLLDEFPLGQSDADLLVKPVDTGDQYWGREESHPTWRALYEQVGLEFSGSTMKSTVDGYPIPALWNAGVVVTDREELAEDWLKITQMVRDEVGDPEAAKYADQVALGIVSRMYKTSSLAELDNYPLPCYWWTPSDIRVLHYHDFRYLATTVNPSIRRELSKLNVTSSEMFPSLSRTAYLGMARIVDAFING